MAPAPRPVTSPSPPPRARCPPALHSPFVAPPSVPSFTPTPGSTNGGTSVTITGTGFSGASAVHFGTTTAFSFHVTSATTITAVTRAHAAGTVTVSVTTAYGTGPSGSDFTFVAPP